MILQYLDQTIEKVLMTEVREVVDVGVLAQAKIGAPLARNASFLHSTAMSIFAEGQFFPSKDSFLKHLAGAYKGRVINFYNDIELNAGGVAGLQRSPDVNAAMKVMLLSHGCRIVAGMPIQGIVASEIDRLQRQSQSLIDRDAAQKWSGLAGSVKYVTSIAKGLNWLTENRSKFTGRPLAVGAMARCLLWGESIKDQSLNVKKALGCLGVDGSFSVNGRNFLNRDMAIFYLERLVERGRKVAMSSDSTLVGRDAYTYLKHKHGDALPELLCSHGVYGVSYGKGYTSLLG